MCQESRSQEPSGERAALGRRNAIDGGDGSAPHRPEPMLKASPAGRGGSDARVVCVTPPGVLESALPPRGRRPARRAGPGASYVRAAAPGVRQRRRVGVVQLTTNHKDGEDPALTRDGFFHLIWAGKHHERVDLFERGSPDALTWSELCRITDHLDVGYYPAVLQTHDAQGNRVWVSWTSSRAPRSAATLLRELSDPARPIRALTLSDQRDYDARVVHDPATREFLRVWSGPKGRTDIFAHRSGPDLIVITDRWNPRRARRRREPRALRASVRVARSRGACCRRRRRARRRGNRGCRGSLAARRGWTPPP